MARVIERDIVACPRDSLFGRVRRFFMGMMFKCPAGDELKAMRHIATVFFLICLAFMCGAILGVNQGVMNDAEKLNFLEDVVEATAIQKHILE